MSNKMNNYHFTGKPIDSECFYGYHERCQCAPACTCTCHLVVDSHTFANKLAMYITQNGQEDSYFPKLQFLIENFMRESKYEIHRP